MGKISRTVLTCLRAVKNDIRYFSSIARLGIPRQSYRRASRYKMISLKWYHCKIPLPLRSYGEAILGKIYKGAFSWSLGRMRVHNSVVVVVIVPPTAISHLYTFYRSMSRIITTFCFVLLQNAGWTRKTTHDIFHAPIEWRCVVWQNRTS